jgi:3-dehydrotetronate 4-kinase
MSTLFGAIADDFTGATDLAGLLARSGVPVSLRIGVPREAPGETAPLEIIALKCRTAPTEAAVAETRDALAWLRRAGATRFFWKYCSTFDSTARGNIGPVAEALMDDLGASQTVYCPAFPENGRSVFMGNLFVGELPLAESPMKDHPLTPMRDSNLMRLLAPQVRRPVGLANRLVVAQGPGALRQRLAELRENGTAHVVVDAVANHDLVTIAEACQDMSLLTGGSALAMPLPDLWLKEGLLSRWDRPLAARHADGPAIVLSGSCSAMTNRQVAAYLSGGSPSFRLDPLALAEQGPAPALQWLAGQDLDATPIIYATAEPASVRAAQDKLGTERAGALVEDALAACAVAARDAGARRLVVAGGETSGAVAKALGIDRLDIGVEIAPGVPWCFARSGGHDVAITLKSGNFGQETFFADALEKLTA